MPVLRPDESRRYLGLPDGKLVDPHTGEQFPATRAADMAVPPTAWQIESRTRTVGHELDVLRERVEEAWEELRAAKRDWESCRVKFSAGIEGRVAEHRALDMAAAAHPDEYGRYIAAKTAVEGIELEAKIVAAAKDLVQSQHATNRAIGIP